MLFPVRDFQRTSTAPTLTITLILINIGVFIYHYVLLGETASYVFTIKYGFLPCQLLAGCSVEPIAYFPAILSIFTSMFLHGNLIHLLGNMWFLWIFGDNIEDRMGKFSYLLFYLLGGVIAALVQMITDIGSDVVMIGASGAIAAVMGAYIVLYPKGKILSLFFWWPVVLPAILILGYWFLLQVLYSSSGGSGVAYMAHIGGFIAGALLIRMFAKPPASTQYYDL